MKKLFVIMFILLAAELTFPQEETLISGKVENGGYGAPVVKFSKIKNNFAVLVGGYGGWFINHTFLIGGGGYGLVNRIRGEESARVLFGFWDDIRIQFGYGGLVLEYVNNSQSLLHYSISALVGAGEVSYNNYFSEDFSSNDWLGEKSEVFVLEPSLNAEMNITKFFRINIGAGYRYVSGTHITGLTNSDLCGPSANITFKFGSF